MVVVGLVGGVGGVDGADGECIQFIGGDIVICTC